MKYVIEHNVRLTTVPTKAGKEYLLPNGLRNWSGAKSRAKKFETKTAAVAHADSQEMGDYVVVL